MKRWLVKTLSDASGPGLFRSGGRLEPAYLQALARRHAGDALMIVGAGAYLTWILLWQYTRFIEGHFGYHDLTLITDFFTNALHHGKPFWITDFGVHHFKTHFTPTLLLLTPFFLFFKSQFALIAIVAAIVTIGLFVAAREQHGSLKEAGAPLFYRVLLTASFFLLLAFNRYTVRCMDSAHFEPVFILPAMLVIAAVRRGSSYARVAGACLLALGVRQDTGLFLFFLLLACFFAPASWAAMQRTRVAAAACICLAYVLFATKFALPWFGSDTATRMWARWGDTWPDVFMSWTEHPEQVYAAVGGSEFLAWNAEFYFLHVIHGLAWLLTQLPAVLFYTADAWDKQHLAYYNASFLLPGVALCLGFAQLHAVGWIVSAARARKPMLHLGFTLLTGIFAYAALDIAFLGPRENEDTLQVGELKRSDVFNKPQLKRLLRCSEVKSVATDFHSIVFVPNRLDRYLPRSSERADAVVVRRDNRDAGAPFYIAPEVLRDKLLKDGKFRLAFSIDDYDIYVATSITCPEDGNT